MEERFERFSHLSEAIFNCLDNKSLVKCKEVSRIWCDYISEQKLYHIRIIHLTVGKFHEVGRDWKKVFRKGATNTMKNLRHAVEQFYLEKNNVHYYEGLTPIHVAAGTGDLSLLEEIQKTAQEKYPEDSEAFTPLHYAAQNGHLNICKALIENMPNKNPKGKGILFEDKKGWTPLHSAAREGHFEIFKLIGSEIEDINPKMGDNSTPLHKAAIGGHLNIVNYVMTRLDDKYPQDIKGYTPLHMAAHNGHLPVVEFIMHGLENKNPRNIIGDAPLHLAAYNGHLKVVECIMAVIEDKNPRCPVGFTPLHGAAYYGHWKVCELILRNISDKAPLWDGKSPLALASENNHSLVCILFMDENIEENAFVYWLLAYIGKARQYLQTLFG